MPIVRIEYLAERPDAVGTITTWFESEWPNHYGPEGPGNANADAESFANRTHLPIGILATIDREPVGFMVLKEHSIDTHPHLGPWIAAAYVTPQLRRNGIGAAMIAALEAIAAENGFGIIYCGTATAETLMTRLNWRDIETLEYHGANLTIFSKQLH